MTLKTGPEAKPELVGGEHGDGLDGGAQTQAVAPRRPSSNTLNDLTGREWIKFTKTWFVCDSARYRRNKVSELHPARFPEEMVSEFVLFFTKRGQWVFDPFCGSGATLVACLEQERNAVGLELSERYAQIARRRVDQTLSETSAWVLEGDARQMLRPELWEQAPEVPATEAGLPSFDFIITSPPYWNMLGTSRGRVRSTHKRRAERGLDTIYSDDARDLGNIADYGAFIEALGGVFDDCRFLLRSGGYLVVVAQNLRRPDGEVAPLAWDLGRRISRSFSFQGERLWCQNSKQLGIWGYPRIFVPNYHHHYCLIFQNHQTQAR